MKTSAAKQQGMVMQEIQRQRWWLEVIRGIITITFGLLLFLASRYSMHVLIYALGSYLIIDGALDLSYLAKARCPIQEEAFQYLTAATNIVIGLVSFLLPVLATVVLAQMIAIWLLLRAVRVIRQARRSRRNVAIVSWLYGGLLALWGLLLVLFPLLTWLSLIVFMSLYAVCDGLYVMGRGLLLRLAPADLTARASQAHVCLGDEPDSLAPSRWRGMVFVRRLGANGFGHTGWAFEWKNGWFTAGSVENPTGKPYANPQAMGFWTAYTPDPVAVMKRQPHPYDEYKLFFVVQPHPRKAWKTVIWESRQPYAAFHQNCIDVVYDVLRTYGATELLDPAQEPVPNDWFDALPGPSYRIADHPLIPGHLHRASLHALTTKETMLTIPPSLKGTAPAWHRYGWRALEELMLMWEKMFGDVQRLFSRGTPID